MEDQVRAILKKFDARRDGISVVAKGLGLGPSTVFGWIKNGHIPTWRQRDLLALALEKGVPLSPTDFPSKRERAAA